MIKNLPYNVVSEGQDFKVFSVAEMQWELTENVAVQQQGTKTRNDKSYIYLVKLWSRPD